MDAQFNATGRTNDLGYVAAEWQLTDSSTNNHGDNWMLVADWAVRAHPSAATPFPVEGADLTTNGFPIVKWTGTYGFNYAIEYSADLNTWTSGLPNSVFTNVPATTPLTFTNISAFTQRYFRVRRSFAP